MKDLSYLQSQANYRSPVNREFKILKRFIPGRSKNERPELPAVPGKLPDFHDDTRTPTEAREYPAQYQPHTIDRQH
ncbi:hypothetical protein QE152_g27472 [Popillia japonica]|uniref:Uncharacterized protein n=1 Tax=Popillia japonica TaxID=7064 RepID=A0AAW1JVP8_POPJA